MSRELDNLQGILDELLAEHRKLLGHLDAQQSAMRAMDVEAIEDKTLLQESSRRRIGELEARRRIATQQIAKAIRWNETAGGELTISRLAELFPPRAAGLLKSRDGLRAIIEQVQSRSTIVGRVASAVAGHLGTALRLLSGAVQGGGTYTKHGVPNVAKRIGAIEAVG